MDAFPHSTDKNLRKLDEWETPLQVDHVCVAPTHRSLCTAVEECRDMKKEFVQKEQLHLRNF